MEGDLTFRFLGTGTSVGVPQIGCDCPVCTSSDPRDRRRRCGAYVTAADGAAFLYDGASGRTVSVSAKLLKQYYPFKTDAA